MRFVLQLAVLSLPFLAWSGCSSAPPDEEDLKAVLNHLLKMEDQTRTNGMGASPAPSGIVWRKDPSLLQDHVKLEYSELDLTKLSYRAKVSYYSSHCDAPVFDLNGTMDFFYNASDNEHKTVAGTFTLSGADRARFALEEVSFALDIHQSLASGSVVADGSELTWTDCYYR